MNDEEKKSGRRSEPRVWLYTEHWLWGSTRSEYTLEERAIFIDLLCLGITGMGKVDITHPKQLATQLLVPFDILQSTIDKGIKYGKFAIKKDKKHLTAFKTYLTILNWKRYQPQYLHEKPLKSTRRARSDKGGKRDAHVGPIYKSIGEDSIGGEGTLQIPPIPKDLPFKIKDQLSEMKAYIYSRKKLLLKPDTLGRRQTKDGRQYTKEILEAEIGKLIDEMKEAIEAYS